MEMAGGSHLLLGLECWLRGLSLWNFEAQDFQHVFSGVAFGHLLVGARSFRRVVSNFHLHKKANIYSACNVHSTNQTGDQAAQKQQHPRGWFVMVGHS